MHRRSFLAGGIALPAVAAVYAAEPPSLASFIETRRIVLNSRLDGPGWLPDGGFLTVEAGFQNGWTIQRFVSITDPTHGGMRSGRPQEDRWQWMPWQPLRGGRYAGKRVMVVGDSIASDGGNRTSIAAHLAPLLCAEVLNCAFGGTGWGPITEGRHRQQFDALCFYQLAKCFASGDSGPVTRAAASLKEASNGTWDYTWPAQNFAAAVANPPDALLMHGGTNDYGRSLPLAKYRRHIRDTLERTIPSIPMTDIILTTPLYRPKIVRNKLGLTIDDYADALRQIGAEYRLKVIDLARESSLNSLNAAARLSDGTHTTPAYREALARQIAAAL